MKQINSITNDRIKYISDDGKERFIDFRKCNTNWIQYRKKTENLTGKKLLDIKNHDKIVG